MITGAPLLGVFGGTFDPVHLGHMRVIEALTTRLNLDRLHIIPARQSPFKPVTGATAEQRLQMLQLAMAGQHGFFIDDCEYQRSGPSYTVDTLGELKCRYPRHHLVLIIGADTFASLAKWQQYEALPKLTHLAVMNRQGTAKPKLEAAGFTALGLQYLGQQAGGGLLAVEVPSPAISSSAIRSCIANGKDVGVMLHPVVWTYIKQHQLYDYKI